MGGEVGAWSGARDLRFAVLCGFLLLRIGVVGPVTGGVVRGPVSGWRCWCRRQGFLSIARPYCWVGLGWVLGSGIPGARCPWAGAPVGFRGFGFCGECCLGSGPVYARLSAPAATASGVSGCLGACWAGGGMDINTYGKCLPPHGFALCKWGKGREGE